MDVDLARKLVKDTAKLIDDAYQNNLDSTLEASRLELLDDEVEKLKIDGFLAPQVFQNISDEQVKQKFEQSFLRSKQVATLAGFKAPEIEEFEHAGCDFEALAKVVAENPDFEPVIAPYGWGFKNWENVFKQIAGSENKNVLNSNSFLDPQSPLEVGKEISREFALLDRLANANIAGTKTVSVTGGSVTDVDSKVSDSQVIGSQVSWTLRLIPAAPKPNKMGLNYAAGPHVTLPEMLMLQLTKLLQGQELVDQNTFTWLAGLLSDGKLAARHVYDAGQKQIIITSREKGNQGPHLGARTPVCG